MKGSIALIPAVAFCFFAFTIEGRAQAPDASCEAWQYEPDGGFEGGQESALISCDDTVRIDILCGGDTVSFRYSPEDEDVAGATESARPRLEVSFDAPDNPPDFIFYPRYEDAWGEWVVYFPTIDLDHPFFGALMSKSRIELEFRDGKPKTFPLTGASEALQPVLEACEPG